MKIALYSDIHSEFFKGEWYPEINPEADLIVLAGDIGVGYQAVGYVKNISKLHPDKPIVYILGNHEYYGQDIKTLAKGMKDEFKNTNIHLLDNSSVEIDGILFIGSTLWSGVETEGTKFDQNQTKAIVGSAISDFRIIRNGNSRFTVDDMIALNQKAYYYINQSLIDNKDKKKVVVTHFPFYRAHNRSFGVDHLSFYFTNAPKSLPPYDLWLFGHTHDNYIEPTLEGTVYSNQIRYRNEASAHNDNLIEINNT